jgi:hypothetical protein
MMAQEKILFKNRLKQLCESIIEQRISAAKKIIQNIQEAANNEEKSSAGDKYETGRAMGHLQKDMHSRQLNEYLKELAGLHSIVSSLLYETPCAGAFIETNDASFFIAAGLGKQMAEGKNIFFLSPYAPLAAALQNKKAGDSFLFNGKNIMIKDVY